jgi:cytochrome P450
MINDRRKGKTHSYNEDTADLLSILLETDFYQKNDDNLIIDEIFTFFFAGMKTI